MDNLLEKVIEEMIFQIYEIDSINRLFYDDYIDIINSSNFIIHELRNWHKPFKPDLNTRALLEKKYPRKNFDAVSLKILLQKH